MDQYENSRFIALKFKAYLISFCFLVILDRSCPSLAGSADIWVSIICLLLGSVWTIWTDSFLLKNRIDFHLRQFTLQKFHFFHDFDVLHLKLRKLLIQKMNDSCLLLNFLCWKLNFLVQRVCKNEKSVSLLSGLSILELNLQRFDLILHHFPIIRVYLSFLFKLRRHILVSSTLFTCFFLLDFTILLG